MIIYLHGFNSAPASHKARTMQAHMQQRGLESQFICPALPHHPDEATRLVAAEISRHDPRCLTLVGSSLGGFYATWFAEDMDIRAVLINPAINPHTGLEAYLGQQKNLYTSEEYALTAEHLAGWRRLVTQTVDPEKYLLLLETGDEVLDWREAACKYEGARTVIRDGGDHTMLSFAEHLPRILSFAGYAEH